MNEQADNSSEDEMEVNMSQATQVCVEQRLLDGLMKKTLWCCCGEPGRPEATRPMLHFFAVPTPLQNAQSSERRQEGAFIKMHDTRKNNC